jgi:hypothetical protein
MCVKENQTDFDSRITLAEILEATDRKQEALEVMEAVVRDRSHYKPVTELPPETSGALIPNRVNRAPITEYTRPRRAFSDRAVLEAQRRESVLIRWDQLEECKTEMGEGKKEAVERWCTVARSLVDEFCAVKPLFPVEKARWSAWFEEDTTNTGSLKETKPTRKRKLDIEARVEELQSRLQDPGALL